MRTISKRRILMLLENRPYPQDVRVRREADALVSAGYSVAVVCPADPGQQYWETVKGVHVYRYPAPRPASGFLGYLWEYGYSLIASFVLSVWIFLREGFDAIHAHNPPDVFVFIALLFKPFGTRFVFDHHDLSPEMYQARFRGGGSGVVYKVLVSLEKLTCRCADHVIVTNESYKKFAMSRGQVPEECISIVRNGVELSSLNRSTDASRPPGPNGRAIIGYVGVMGFQEGLDYLLRAIHHLVRDLGRTDFHCILIGDGDALASLKKLSRDLGLGEYVEFLGPVFGEALLRLLSQADICVEPSPANPYTNHSTMFKIMEYMALGKPVVAFDLMEHRFTARDAAVFVQANDELAFAKAIASLLDDPPRRQALGASGMRRFRTEIAWEYSVPNLLRAYQTVLPESAKGGAGFPGDSKIELPSERTIKTPPPESTARWEPNRPT